MPWAMETRMGFVWAILVALLFLLAVVAMAGLLGSALRTPAILLIPIVVYIGFLAWVNRVN